MTWAKLKRETGGLARKPYLGQKGKGKLEPYKNWIRNKVAEQGDITLAELARDLKKQFGVDVQRWSVERLLHQLGLSNKKATLCPRAKPERYWRMDLVAAALFARSESDRTGFRQTQSTFAKSMCVNF